MLKLYYYETQDGEIHAMDAISMEDAIETVKKVLKGTGIVKVYRRTLQTIATVGVEVDTGTIGEGKKDETD